MISVNFPKTRVPVLTRLCNLIKTKGDILTPKERSYANSLTKEIRENIVPWAETSEGNDRILAEIRQEFKDKVKQEEPKKHQKIIRNVEDYVFKEAKYHFGVMAEPSVQSKLANTDSPSAQVLENALKRDEHWGNIEKILGAKLKRNSSWEEIKSQLKAKGLHRKQIQWCYGQYKKIIEYDAKRIDNVIKRENLFAANEAAARQYGFWKSYDYAYNIPISRK